MISKVASRFILLIFIASKLSAEATEEVDPKHDVDTKISRLPTPRTIEMATIRQCVHTSIADGYHNNVFFNSTCPPNDSSSLVESNICGAEPLKFGRVTMKKFFGGEKTIYVTLQGTNAHTLFRVYFLPIGANPCTEKVFVGDIITGLNGRTGRNGKLLRNCGNNPWPACLNNKASLTNAIDPFDAGILPDVGFLLFYSRGNSLKDGTWITRDGPRGSANTAFGVLDNDVLWEGEDQFGGIQYIAALG